MNKFTSIILSAAIILCICSPSFAINDSAKDAAESLNSLGLFNGVGTNADGTPNFDLDRTPSRNEAVTMLVRLLGKENEAKSQEWETPFQDLDVWVSLMLVMPTTISLQTESVPLNSAELIPLRPASI